MTADRPRQAALEVLRAVREDDAYANLVGPQVIHGFGLTGRDAGLATELAYGTLRWRGLYDAILTPLVTRSWDRVEPALQDVLRLGAHQLLAMRVPDHAAVDSSCDLARAAGAPPGAAARAGFVNAVLRKVAARDVEGWATQLQGGRADDDLGWLSTRWSHPTWITRALRDALGPRRDELVDLLGEDAGELGCRAELERTREIVAGGTSADRQLTIHRGVIANGGSAGDGYRAVVDWLVETTLAGVPAA